MLKLIWDDAKRESNIIRHGIDFADLLELFENVTETQIDDRFDYGEERLLTLGILDGRVIVVAHVETVAGDDVDIRVISARIANKNEQKEYFEKVRD